ncbi:hypothetical protein AKO1_010897 [Acrasis kona]|uniref:Uncharacterized protein n=1 Tax=Acrasis kona TaxID=1008807 RepID=A0AAW2YHR1_9EUKA
MFITSVCYDYYKGFVTAFIEINGAEQETIFGKPPMEKIVRIVNVAALIEQLVLLLFTVFVVIHMAVGSPSSTSIGFSLWIVWAPILGLFCVLAILAFIGFFYYVFCSFRHVRSTYWLIAYFFIFPIAFVNFCLFFGMPILVSILMPIQHETVLYQSPKTWDWTLYLVLWMVGALMKGFVRPTEDPMNPFSNQMPNIITSFVYFLFFFLCAAFIFLLTARTDLSIPFADNSSFPSISYWIIFIPYYIAIIMVFVTFAVKAAFEWRLVIKQKDPNGDGYFKAINYTTILIFLILMFVTGILLCYKLELPSNRQREMSTAVAIVLVPIASFLMLLLSIFPFVDYIKKVIQKKIAEKKKQKKLEAASPSAQTAVEPVDETKGKDVKDVELQEDPEAPKADKNDGANGEKDEQSGSDKKKEKKEKDDDSDSDDSSDAESDEQINDDGYVEMLCFL